MGDDDVERVGEFDVGESEVGEREVGGVVSVMHVFTL